MTRRALVLLAPGCEEMEAVIAIDVLRRAGIEVVASSLGVGPVHASRGVVLVPDTALAAVLDEALGGGFDVVVLPGGGPGAAALRDDPRVLELLRVQAAAGRTCAAICAAPTVLARAGLLTGRRATAHPSVQAELRAAGVLVDAAARVVIDDELITSQAAGTSFEFAYALVARFAGAAKVEELEAGIRSRP